MSDTTDFMPDAYVAEFLDLARSANVHFDLINDRLTMRASNPNWVMWRPCRHLLDEIGAARIAAYLKTSQAQQHSVAA
jgi:hypothetical protein